MVYKALIGGIGQDLNNVADNFGLDADVIVVMDDSNYEWSNQIKTYEGDDYIDLSLPGANGVHVIIPGSGNDYVLGGSSTETVLDGAGDDTYILGGSIDIVRDGPGDDYADGGSGGDDTIYFNMFSGDGRAADQRIDTGVTYDLSIHTAQDLGVFGHDTLLNFELVIGSFGNDHFYGDNGENGFWAYDGDDVIYARGGNDTIYGYAGSDIIIGGAGADKIDVHEDGQFHVAGGSPFPLVRDIIRYTSVRDSGTTNGTRDHIYYFDSGAEAGADRIDLSRIDANHFKSGNQAFVMRSSASRFASSAGEVKLQEVNHSYTIVHIDTDSDAADEMQIVVHSVGLTKADFIL